MEEKIKNTGKKKEKNHKILLGWGGNILETVASKQLQGKWPRQIQTLT